MAKLGGFNASEHQDLESFDAIDPGEYIGKIVESEMKENNAKTGSYLKLKFQITQGKYAKRILWTNLNLDHPNPDAVEIANRHLAAICKAVGVLAPEDSEQLHGVEISLKVSKKKATNDYPESNDIKSYSKVDGVEQPTKQADSSAAKNPVSTKKKRVTFE